MVLFSGYVTKVSLFEQLQCEWLKERVSKCFKVTFIRFLFLILWLLDVVSVCSRLRLGISFILGTFSCFIVRKYTFFLNNFL